MPIFTDIETPKQAALPNQIEHVIVLMLENRSFDHMLGYLNHPDETFDGLKRESYPDGHAPLETTPNARYSIYPGPSHGHEDTMHQLLGHRELESNADTYKVTNSGFADNYEAKVAGKHSELQGKGYGKKVMRSFNPTMVPVLSTLAKEFAVCDRWFSSAPMGTFPNRDFLHAGTAFGRVENSPFLRDHRRTIFFRLQQEGRSWCAYGSPSGCHTWLYPKLFAGNGNNRRKSWTPTSLLLRDIATDSLPTYAFVEPDYGDIGIGGTGNSQHPSQADSLAEFVGGEKLIGEIYDALVKEQTRPDSKKVFEKTAFIITYDEHGGFYDHVPPPTVFGLDPSDMHRSGDYTFKYNLLGPRVPAVIVSPWVERHKAHHTVYDHTSIYQTLRMSFCNGNRMPSTTRDGTANTFSDVFTRSTPRLPRAAATNGTADDYPLLLERNSVSTARALERKLAAAPDETDTRPEYDDSLSMLNATEIPPGLA
jgi:phospholipase C